jgi:ketosteroid isomerase-like protein
MKDVLFLCVILLCSLAYPQETAATATAVPQKHCAVPADDAALSRIAEQWKDGYNNGHAADVASLYAENATYLTQHLATGIVQGRAAIQAYVQRGIDAKYHVDSIQILSTVCSGDLAYTIGRYESTNAGQKAFGVNLVVLRKIGGKWLIVAHESAVPDPATAIQNLDIPRGH